MSAAPYSAHGPVRGQDGQPCWVVVRQLEGCTRLVAIAESRSAQAAWQHALELNAAAERADAMGMHQDVPARGPRPAFLPTAWPFPLAQAARGLLRRPAARASRMPAGDDAPF